MSSKEAQAAWLEAQKNSAKYVAMFGGVAGSRDDLRKTLDDYEADEIYV